MSRKNNNYVKKQTLYIGIGVSLVVGVLIGIVFSASQSNTTVAPRQNAGQAATQQQQGPQISAQQASRLMNLEKRVAANPQDVDAWTRLGHLYYDLNRVEKAIAAYSRSLELSPNNPDVLTDRGVMYRRAGRPEEAVASFNKALAVAPTHQQSRFNKGIVLLNDLHDAKGAVDAWEELLKLNPTATTPNGLPLSKLIDDIKSKFPPETK